MADLIKMAEKSESAFHKTPEDVLEQTLKDYQNKTFKGRKIIVIVVEDSDELMNIYTRKAGVGCVDGNMFLDVVKMDGMQRFLEGA